MFFRSRSFFCLAIACLCAIASQTSALEPTTPLGKLSRQSWTMENGLPQNTISVLLQSRSGFIWAGTELGLARFDGTSFRLFDHGNTARFPDAEVRCALEDRSGNLWIGTSDGLVRLDHLRNGQLTSAEGLPSASIRGLAQTTDGALWAWTDAGLAQSSGQAFHPVAMPAGLSAITSIAAGSTGSLWVATSRGAAVYRQSHWESPSAQPHPALVAQGGADDVLLAGAEGVFLAHTGKLTSILPRASLPEDGVSFLAQLADGATAVAGKSTVLLAGGGHPTARFSVARELPGSRIETLFADREGSLWIGTNHGLARIASSHGLWTAQPMPQTDPLAGNAILSLMEDQEGDLWVGTETSGLHILRDTRFRSLGAGDGLASDATTAIVQDTGQSVWVGTRDSGLNRIVAGRITALTTANGLLSNVILALAAAPDGSLWVGTPDGLNHIDKQGIRSYTSADGLPDDFIRSLLVAPDNSLWIGTRRGLTHLAHDRFQTLTQADGLGSDLVGALTRTPDGDLWIATLDGLSQLHQGKLRNFTTADGLSSNVITALEAGPDGQLWIGTQNDGLNLGSNGRFSAVHAANLPSAVHAILLDGSRHLWIASDHGLTRAGIQALLECAQPRPCQTGASSAISYTTADGLRSRETSSNSHPTVLRSADGELWFTTPRGVEIVDPRHFPATPAAPPVAIERFAVDDRDQNPDAPLRIPAGALRFEFDYAGLSFAAPQKLRYQYMLEGFDHAWTDAGTRRTAYYTNIPAAHYRFRVRAALGDGGFSDRAIAAGRGPGGDPATASYTPLEAAIDFELLPHYYQTFWFRALIVAASAALLLLIFRRRVLRVEREFRAVMAERNRIAREIHDTLAQGYVGISLQLEILGQLLRHNRTEAATQHLALTQTLVREGLDEARQSIWALRSQDSAETTLPIRLRRLAEQANGPHLQSEFEVYGAFRALTPEAEQEVLRIAQEAIQNVKRHAAASELSMRLEYREREILLTVSDNGKGFEFQPEQAAEGHYGLTGMRERAAVLGASIRIESQPGNGTSIQLRIPETDTAARGREAPRAASNVPLSPDADRAEPAQNSTKEHS